jgi:hypothetical protein
MDQNTNYGRTAFGPVVVLPEQVMDMSEGQPLPAPLGKTGVPVHVLPAWEVDFGPTVPAMFLRLTLKPGATPAEVVRDLFRLYAAVNQLDLGQQGSGLLPCEAICEEPPSKGILSVTFKPANPQGAAERLAMVVRAIQGTAKDYPSLQGCEAMVGSVAV